MAAPLMLSVSGCRGIVGQSLTADVAARFAGAFAGILAQRQPGPTVVLGRDGRAGCEMVHHAAIAGLIGAGANVVDLGVAMTPTVAIMTDKHKAAGGMVLTASHNPQEWNGLKCLLGEGRNPAGSAACAPPARLAAQIIDRFNSGAIGAAAWSAIGRVEHDGAGSVTHADRVLDAIAESFEIDPGEIGRETTVVLDSVNASGAEGGMTLLERLGCEEIMHIGGQSTGLFPHPPEPIKANLQALCESVREIDAAVGFAQDPDADRLAIVDEKGEYIGEEYTLALGAMAVLEAAKRHGPESRGAVLATNLSTSRMLDDVAARYGARVIRTAVGEANVVEAMKNKSALVGGEGNGGVIWPRITFVRDSLSAMALVLALIEITGKTVSQLVADIPSYAIVKDKIELKDRDRAEPALEKVAAAFKAHRIDRQDGVWIGLDTQRAWLHVRASNTEPIMRFIAEAPDEGSAQKLIAQARRAIE